MKRSLLIVGITLLTLPLSSRTLTLQECRDLALGAASSQSAEQLQLAAEANRKAAYAAMFPRVTANAAYTYSTMDMTLLPSEMNLGAGTAYVAQDGSSQFFWDEGSAMGQMVQQTRDMAVVGDAVQQLATASGQMIADGYKQLYDQMNLDAHHVFVAQVGVTQPIYVGGRLRELYTISKLMEQTVALETDKHHDEVIVSVDEAYWRVISVQHKQELAEQYYNLLVKLEGDVEVLVESGLATQSDLLKVKQKRGEAELKRLQARNGLQLSRMALCQLCGLDLDEPIELDESGLDEAVLHDTVSDYRQTVGNRPELRMLENATKIAESNAKIIAAGLQPNIVAQANYVYSNLSADNGLSSDWRGKGFFTAGIAVNIPIAHADDIYRLKAAKHSVRAAQLKVDETRELLELQVVQANQRVLEAQQKVAMTRLAVKNSEEVLRLAQESFKAGMIPVSELMQAETAWMAACTDKIDAEIEAKVTESYFKRYTK
ncbi:MAG: TolC family protein [Paludibacteraceae bacterium]|nr:TolC family protein [Paludibacteraceae bacterium]